VTFVLPSSTGASTTRPFHVKTKLVKGISTSFQPESHPPSLHA
jgi:hypothetical protein